MRARVSPRMGIISWFSVSSQHFPLQDSYIVLIAFEMSHPGVTPKWGCGEITTFFPLGGFSLHLCSLSRINLASYLHQTTALNIFNYPTLPIPEMDQEASVCIHTQIRFRLFVGLRSNQEFGNTALSSWDLAPDRWNPTFVARFLVKGLWECLFLWHFRCIWFVK